MKYTNNHIKLEGAQKYIRKGIGLLVRKMNKRQKKKSVIDKKARYLSKAWMGCNFVLLGKTTRRHEHVFEEKMLMGYSICCVPYGQDELYQLTLQKI